MNSYDLLDQADLLELGLMAASDPSLFERSLSPNDAKEAELEDADRR